MRLAIQLKATVADAAIVVIRDVRNWLGCLRHAPHYRLGAGNRRFGKVEIAWPVLERVGLGQRWPDELGPVGDRNRLQGALVDGAREELSVLIEEALEPRGGRDD